MTRFEDDRDTQPWDRAVIARCVVCGAECAHEEDFYCSSRCAQQDEYRAERGEEKHGDDAV